MSRRETRDDPEVREIGGEGRDDWLKEIEVSLEHPYCDTNDVETLGKKKNTRTRPERDRGILIQ